MRSNIINRTNCSVFGIDQARVSVAGGDDRRAPALPHRHTRGGHACPRALKRLEMPAAITPVRLERVSSMRQAILGWQSPRSAYCGSGTAR